MSGATFCFDEARFDKAAEAFIEDGPQDSRALREAKVACAREVLFSKAARANKLCVTRMPHQEKS